MTRFTYSGRQQGFTIIEVVVALALVTLAVLLVGGLGQQVANLARSSKQTGAVIELRTKTNAISRNLETWLQKMRSTVSVGGVGIYAGCIPDRRSNISTFKCPAIDDSIFTRDQGLKDLAQTKGLHVIDAPIVDTMGSPLAGTLDAPVYLDIEGRMCKEAEAATKCPLKSTGYFLRKNDKVDENPLEVSFVVKIEKNPSANLNGLNNIPLKPQYTVVDVGTEWQKPVQFLKDCIAGFVKVGYLLDGNPQCLSATAKCVSPKIQVGIDANGVPVCLTPPTTCAANEKVILDPVSKTLICSSDSACNSGVFVGYYTGTGQAICPSETSRCPNGSVQVGQNNNGNVSTPKCATVPTCTSDKPVLSYNGQAFICLSDNSGSSIVGQNGLNGLPGEAGSDGAANNGADGAAGTDGQDGADGKDGTNIFERCDPGYYVAGINGKALICEKLPGQTPPAQPTYVWYTSDIKPSSAAKPGNRGVAGSCQTTCSARGKTATGRCHSGENSPMIGEIFPPQSPELASNGLWNGTTYRFKGPYGKGIGKTFNDVWCYKANGAGERTQKDDKDWSDVAEACECN